MKQSAGSLAAPLLTTINLDDRSLQLDSQSLTSNAENKTIHIIQKHPGTLIVRAKQNLLA
jgi:hypothetical protein